MSLPFLPDPARLLRSLVVGRVQALFNDRAKGEKPVIRSAEALFPPGSTVWRVHGDVTTMMIGGIAALLLQMLHPAALAGVWDYSDFRSDMLGRLRRTARFIAITTYAPAGEAEAMIARVKAIHAQVRGALPDGTPYAASDPALLAWVHACEAHCFLEAWLRYGDPAMTAADQDEYLRQSGDIALRLGADPVPQTRAELSRLIAAMRPQLRVDDRVREVAGLVIAQPPASRAAEPVRRMLTEAAIDLLPDWARALHGLERRPIGAGLARPGSMALARTLRWAFAGSRNPVSARDGERRSALAAGASTSC